MSNRCLKRGFSLGAFAIDVNPLAVLGSLRKFVDSLLRNRQPIAHANFFSNKLFQHFRRFKRENGHAASRCRNSFRCET